MLAGASIAVFLPDFFHVSFLPSGSWYGYYVPVHTYLPLATAKGRVEVSVAKHRRDFALNQHCRVKNRKSFSPPRSKVGKTPKETKNDEMATQHVTCAQKNLQKRGLDNIIYTRYNRND